MGIGAGITRTGECSEGKWISYSAVHDDHRVEGFYVSDRDPKDVPDLQRAGLGNAMIKDHQQWSRHSLRAKFIRKVCELITDPGERARIREEHAWMRGDHPFYPWVKFSHIPAKEQPARVASI